MTRRYTLGLYKGILTMIFLKKALYSSILKTAEMDTVCMTLAAWGGTEGLRVKRKMPQETQEERWQLDQVGTMRRCKPDGCLL